MAEGGVAKIGAVRHQRFPRRITSIGNTYTYTVFLMVPFANTNENQTMKMFGMKTSFRPRPKTGRNREILQTKGKTVRKTDERKDQRIDKLTKQKGNKMEGRRT